LGYIVSSVCGITPEDNDIDIAAMRKHVGKHALVAFDQLVSKSFQIPDNDPTDLPEIIEK
jgi:hypothetical protein